MDQEHEELCELIMIGSGASVHVCPLDHGQEDGLQIEQNETVVDGIRSRNETARNETGELRHRGCKGHDGVPSVGRETANLVVGIHDGFRMRCALHEESLLDIQRRRERT